MAAKQGDTIVTLREIVDRIAFYAENGKPGTSLVSFNAGERLVAATDELGGNVFVEAKDAAGDDVLVPLAQGEWQLA